MKTKVKRPQCEIKRIGEGKIELFQIRFELSQKDKLSFLKDEPAYLKRLLERQGHKVNDLIIGGKLLQTTRLLVEKSPRGPVPLGTIVAHIVSPKKARSKFIKIETIEGGPPL